MTKRTIWNRRNLMRTTAASCAAALGLTLSACSATADAETLLEEAQDGGTLRVAYADEEPFAYTDSDGNVVGQSVAMHTYLLGELGIEEDQIDWVQTEWDSLIPGLGSNHDMVIAGMYVNADRCEAALFADPDYVMPDTLLVPAGNPENLENINSFIDRDDLVVGVMNGTTEHANVEQDLELDDSQYDVHPNLSALVRELKAGRIDAVALTDINLRLEAEADDDLDTVEPFWPTDADGNDIIGAGAVVFPDGANNFRDAVNEILHETLEDRDLWLSLVGEYGFNEDNIPDPDITAENICGDSYQ
ncbi:transporter substrate-binding domain-containing protein [Natronoglycomyces albus]|uniref:Transporter substrate-binding domain-containing protein n=1 Tax=Natronoglycomyces albus TaxID=2811108 RepID=A0A895XUQ7_9ACTN|nr:transporter substrate-binding domain-containing protein [Natronoglycomyces albus]QSB05960.1 transporter substrate-binding domain-containing protein [Natronoglycomyces albus]